MRKYRVHLLIALAVVAVFATMVWASTVGDLMTLGYPPYVSYGQGTFPNSAGTTATLTSQGVRTGDYVLVTSNTASAAYPILGATAQTDGILITFGTDPGTTVTITYMTWK